MYLKSVGAPKLNAMASKIKNGSYSVGTVAQTVTKMLLFCYTQGEEININSI